MLRFRSLCRAREGVLMNRFTYRFVIVQVLQDLWWIHIRSYIWIPTSSYKMQDYLTRTLGIITTVLIMTLCEEENASHLLLRFWLAVIRYFLKAFVWSPLYILFQTASWIPFQVIKTERFPAHYLGITQVYKLMPLVRMIRFISR